MDQISNFASMMDHKSITAWADTHACMHYQNCLSSKDTESLAIQCLNRGLDSKSIAIGF